MSMDTIQFGISKDNVYSTRGLTRHGVYRLKAIQYLTSPSCAKSWEEKLGNRRLTAVFHKGASPSADDYWVVLYDKGVRIYDGNKDWFKANFFRDLQLPPRPACLD